MTWWHRLARRGQMEHQLDSELRDHFDRLVADYVRGGMAPQEARRRARLQFGGAEHVKEQCRDARGTRWFHDADQDVRFAWRRLAAQRGASIAAVVTLAFAIGAGAAAWSLLTSVLVRPLRIQSPETLAVVGFRDSGPGSNGGFVSKFVYPYVAYLRDSGVFSTVIVDGRVSLIAGPQDTVGETRAVEFVSNNYFDELGIRMAAGREFVPEDDARGAAPTAVLSHRYWRLVFHADPNIVGKTLTVGGKPVSIVGIAAREFRGLTLVGMPDLYMPVETVKQMTRQGSNYFAEEAQGIDSPYSWLTIRGRLKPGATLAHAKAQLDGLAPLGRRKTAFEVTDTVTASLPDAARVDLRKFGRLLALTVGLLLLSGAMSVGMLLLMRTEARSDEFAMCLALGARRSRLARGVVLEGALLAIAGGVAAIPIAHWLMAGVRAFQLPGGVSIELLELSIDRSVWLAVAVGACAAAMVMAFVAATFGFPALHAQSLRSRPGATPRMTRRRTRSVLVVAQIAVALVLLAGAGLFARSLAASLDLNPGVDARTLVTGNFSLGDFGYSQEASAVFFDEFAARLRANPAVKSASISYALGGMSPRGQLYVDGTPKRFPTLVSYVGIDREYLATVGLRIVRGRDFTPDDRENAPRVALVSESFGRLLLDGADPIGHTVNSGSQKPMMVVGVVSDVILNVTVAQPLAMYLPIAQERPYPFRGLTVRAADDPAAAVRETTGLIRQMDARVSPPVLRTLHDRIGTQMGVQRFGATVLGGLGGIAAVLTLLGTYVVAAVMARTRRREMGIRAALGAKGSQLGGLILRENVKLVGVGIACGLGLAWLGAGSIQPFLFRTEPFDVVALGGVAAAMFALMVLISLRPALGASRVDLASVLREE